jgi:hypothetical protein
MSLILPSMWQPHAAAVSCPFHIASLCAVLKLSLTLQTLLLFLLFAAVPATLPPLPPTIHITSPPPSPTTAAHHPQQPKTPNQQPQQEEDDEAYKAKYLRLKARFSKMAQDHLEEVGGLHEEIATLQERLAKTDAARCAPFSLVSVLTQHARGPHSYGTWHVLRLPVKVQGTQI